MKRRKYPPGYPGDDAIIKAFGETVRAIRLEKGLSLEGMNAVVQEAMRNDTHHLLSRALGIVVEAVAGETKAVTCAVESRFGADCALH